MHRFTLYTRAQSFKKYITKFYQDHDPLIMVTRVEQTLFVTNLDIRGF